MKERTRYHINSQYEENIEPEPGQIRETLTNKWKHRRCVSIYNNMIVFSFSFNLRRSAWICTQVSRVIWTRCYFATYEHDPKSDLITAVLVFGVQFYLRCGGDWTRQIINQPETRKKTAVNWFTSTTTKTPMMMRNVRFLNMINAFTFTFTTINSPSKPSEQTTQTAHIDQKLQLSQRFSFHLFLILSDAKSPSPNVLPNVS